MGWITLKYHVLMPSGCIGSDLGCHRLLMKKVFIRCVLTIKCVKFTIDIFGDILQNCSLLFKDFVLGHNFFSINPNLGGRHRA